MGIVIRHAGRNDVDALKAMHAAQGFEYELPDFDRPDWIVRAVLEVDGKPQMCMMLRRTAEAYLLIGKDAGQGTERIGKILALERETVDVARHHLYRDLHAWLPPGIEKNFGRHLLQRGWKQPSWTTYFREI